MNSILYPTDFSENASNAFPYAVDMAKRVNAQLILLHAYDVPLMAPANYFSTRAQTSSMVAKDIRTTSLNQLHAILKAHDLKEVEHKCLVKEGKIDKVILETSTRMDVDLIVMGTHGETASRDLLMGSIAAHMVRNAECPLIIIPQDATFRPIEKVLYTTELQYSENAVFEETINLARIFDASVTFLHVHRYAEKSGDKKEELLAFVKNHDYAKIAVQDIPQDNTFAAIEKYVVKHDIDLLALTTHTTSMLDLFFHKSLTQKMILHSHIPLLAFSQKVSSTVFLP